MHVRDNAFGVAVVVIGLLASGSIARAQWAGGEPPIAIDFSGSGSTHTSYATPSLGRHAALPSQVAALSSVPAPATDLSPLSKPAVADGAAPQSSLLQHLFASGIADLVRGNPADAAEVFEATASTAEIPQLTYLAALAQVLADFDHRDRALAQAKRVMAQDPDHALYRLLVIVADRNLSVLQPDGALYFTPAGAKDLHAAAARLAAQTDAYNGTYLAALLVGVEKTADPALPERLAGFAAMLGGGRSLKLAGVDTPQALGRLFVLSIPPAVLARGEAHLLAGLSDGREPTPVSANARPVIANRASILVP